MAQDRDRPDARVEVGDRVRTVLARGEGRGQRVGVKAATERESGYEEGCARGVA